MMKEDHERPADDRDDVATLVRIAGKRPAVPRDRFERVKGAARAQWQREVRRRSRKRYAWIGAAAATAAAVILVIAFRTLPVGTGVPARSADAMRVEALAGVAWTRVIVDGETSRREALDVGDTLLPGTELLTDDDGRAAIRLASGHSVRLDASSRIRLLEAGSLGLDGGAVYVDSGGKTTADPLDVLTPRGVIREIGTQFEVRLENDSVRVRLREGAVVVQHDDRSDEVRAGAELELAPDGSVLRRPISAHGPEWEWIVGVTPMLDLEGRTAREFLDWIARERGWALAFADESVHRSADTTILSGSTERFALEEALDAVLATCRMTYGVEDGVLTVAAGGGGPDDGSGGLR
jgi:ferric-dicitrate binding protein FerR (iron transport regulator)